MSETIQPGGVITLDPGEKRVIQFDWDTDALPAGVLIAALGSSFVITPVKQNGVGLLAKNNESIVSGSRKTQLRLDASAASEGDYYEVENTVVTDESPAQTIPRHFYVLIQD